ncbi:hypothetical protein DSECCO2_272070 [anaerobic digester metagenome]
MSIKSRSSFIVILLIISFLLGGCRTSVVDNNKNNDENQDVSKAYISITATSQEYENFFYEYDIAGKSISKILSIKDTSQYPMGVVDNKNKKVYYSYRFDHSDQLVMYDIETKETVRLTEDFYAINAIIPVENDIYVLAKTLDKPRIHLIKYVLKSKSYETITEDYIQVESMSYCANSDLIYFSCYNWDEQMILKREYEKDNNSQPVPKNAPYTIYRYDCKSGMLDKVLTTVKLISLIAVADDESIAIIKSADSLFGDKSITLLDLFTKKAIQEIKINNIYRIEYIAFSSDKKGIFFTGIQDADEDYNPNQFGVESPRNCLFYMDFETLDIKNIAGLEGQYINNFVVFN